MKIVYLHQYFVTPDEAGGNRSYYLAKNLAKLGHDVVVITSNYQYASWPFIKVAYESGFKVLYIKNRFDSKMGKYLRIIAYLRFMILATVLAIKEKGTDLVYASSTPIFIGIPALALKIRSGCELVFELRDLWPDVPYELGYIRSRVLFKALKLFENYIYRKSSLIVTISDGIKARIPCIYINKAITCPFGSVLSDFSLQVDSSWRREKLIVADTLVVYTGAVGWANGFDLLLDAASELLHRDDNNIHFAVIGTGSAIDHVNQRIEKEKLSNISMFPQVNASELNRIYASADVGLILFGSTSDTYYNTASPNKFFDYIAAGLPFIYHFGGPLSDEIQKLRIGTKVQKNDVNSLVQCLQSVQLKNNDFTQSRQHIRAMAEEHWDRQRLLSDLAERLTQMVVEKGFKRS